MLHLSGDLPRSSLLVPWGGPVGLHTSTFRLGPAHRSLRVASTLPDPIPRHSPTRRRRARSLAFFRDGRWSHSAPARAGAISSGRLVAGPRCSARDGLRLRRACRRVPDRSPRRPARTIPIRGRPATELGRAQILFPLPRSSPAPRISARARAPADAYRAHLGGLFPNGSSCFPVAQSTSEPGPRRKVVRASPTLIFDNVPCVGRSILDPSPFGLHRVRGPS